MQPGCSWGSKAINEPGVLGHCRSLLSQIWRDLLPPGIRCALALYPDHWNAGDAAIWWGTRRLLAELDVTVAYACDPWSYNPAALRAAVPEGPILLHGGGNFGDAYPLVQQARACLLQDCGERRIIQLPQSLWFRQPGSIDAMASLLAGLSDFTLLVRDQVSLELARAHFPSVSTRLCPDAALALGPLERLGSAQVPVLALWRQDIEGLGELRDLPQGWIARDWLPEDGKLPQDEALLLSTASRGFLAWVGTPPWPCAATPARIHACTPRRRFAWRHQPWLWDQLAEDRSLRGLRILSQGKVVITNRLHAHLLCLLAGIPHVVCDSSNGKVFAHRDTWLADIATQAEPEVAVRFAASPREAVDLAAGLLAQQEAVALMASLGAPSLPASRNDPWVLLNALVETFRAREARQPALLDWDSGGELASRFPELPVFSPCTHTSDNRDVTLPYIDASIDIVALPDGDPVRLAEALRVATAGVVTLSGGEASGQPLQIRVQPLVRPAAARLHRSELRELPSIRPIPRRSQQRP